FQEKLEFDDIYVGFAEPLEADPEHVLGQGEYLGRPVSRGVVEGRARVALTPEEATQLEPGEILVSHITDIGWTPYFSLISGLATDVGSAVSHGAVIAREYGLPAIVNLRVATKVVRTGDRIRLDADRGVLEILESSSTGAPNP
ncbi:MAG: PEP-utilizing enzyme, partial [Myxococcota bacterium]|nr:PEP-utilizing enzyme [Myxococcota bacterium]